MEQSNSSTGIFGILFHIENVGRYFVVLQFFSFSFFMQFLFFIDFKKENNSKNRFSQHFLSPFFSRKQILNTVDRSIETLMKSSVPRSAMNLFMTSGLDSRGSQLSSYFYISSNNYKGNNQVV